MMTQPTMTFAGKRKQPEFGATMIPGIFDGCKRAKCDWCERGRAYNAPEVTNADFDIECTMVESEVKGEQKNPDTTAAKQRYNQQKCRHGTDRKTGAMHPWHAIYSKDPNGFNTSGPEFQSAKDAIALSTTIDIYAAIAAAATKKPAEESIAAAKLAAEKAVSIAKV